MPTLSNEELREKIIVTIANALMAGKSLEQVNKIPAKIFKDLDKAVEPLFELFATQNTALLKELLNHKKTYITELAWKHAASEEAVPTNVINSKLAAMGEQ